MLCVSYLVIASDDDTYSLNLDKGDTFNSRLQFAGPTILNITGTESMDVSIEDGYITHNYINITYYTQYYDMKCRGMSSVIAPSLIMRMDFLKDGV